MQVGFPSPEPDGAQPAFRFRFLAFSTRRLFDGGVLKPRDAGLARADGRTGVRRRSADSRGDARGGRLSTPQRCPRRVVVHRAGEFGQDSYGAPALALAYGE